MILPSFSCKNRLVQMALYSLLLTTLMAQKAQVDSLLKRLAVESTDTGKAKIYRSLGERYMDNNNGVAIDYLNKAVAILKKENEPLQLANNYYSLGYCYLQKSDYANSLSNYLLSVGIYQNLKDSFRLSRAYMSIANVYEYNSDFNKFIQYDNKAEQLINKLKDSALLSALFSQKGNYYGHHQQYDSAFFITIKSTT